jgi:hypothetical protein
MRFAGRLTAGLALALTCCWALALAFAGLSEVLFYLAPGLLILAPLLAGRYVGESLIVKLVAARERRRLRPARVRRMPKAPAIGRLSSGRLIAFSLAERPPPAPAISLT